MSIKTEKKTIEQMIRLYCEAKHGTREALCEECSELRDYALARLSHCPFGEDKPVCRTCEVHCYKPEMRGRVAKIMRFAGPRMLKKNPRSAIRHLLHSIRSK